MTKEMGRMEGLEAKKRGRLGEERKGWWMARGYLRSKRSLGEGVEVEVEVEMKWKKVKSRALKEGQGKEVGTEIGASLNRIRRARVREGKGSVVPCSKRWETAVVSRQKWWLQWVVGYL